ncbi:IS21 family transposase [Eggerthella lenta]|uniref:IS21 family transposase n=1 Tax=Eggerthella lenta TaxID=84112 RepID=UPI00189F65CD|nr:IS21 family transposase [Eggerthella lenta]MDB1787463.1 IS21 family transposase [Eggerthella lenta]
MGKVKSLVSNRRFIVAFAATFALLATLFIPSQFAWGSIADDINAWLCGVLRDWCNWIFAAQTDVMRSLGANGVLSAPFETMLASAGDVSMYAIARGVWQVAVLPIGCGVLGLVFTLKLIEISQRMDGNQSFLTLSLLWNEYCDSAVSRGEEPYMYSAFCREYRKWAQAHDIRMRIDHRPAETIQVDWVGDTAEVVDPDTGELLRVYVFAGCLPYSNYLFAEGFYRTDEQAWIDAHAHMFSFFGGATPVLVPDNCKTAVSKNTKEALIVNEQYRRMSEHYGCAVVPARVRRPRDKASVEMGVGLIERQAMLALRGRRFMSLGEFNSALADQVAAINSRPFQRREGSRESVFLAQEKPLLIPLPATPYEMTARKEVTVNFNYHVCFDGCWYSVPFEFVKRTVAVVATARTVSVMADGTRIAMHERAHRKGEYRTNPDHMPDAHRDYAEWDGARFRSWAESIGEATARAIGAILSSRRIEQQSYRSCRAVLALEKTYGGELLEEACQKALLRTQRPSYKTIKGVIAALAREVGRTDEAAGAYLRGQDYYRKIESAGADNGEKGGR